MPVSSQCDALVENSEEDSNLRNGNVNVKNSSQPTFPVLSLVLRQSPIDDRTPTPTPKKEKKRKSTFIIVKSKDDNRIRWH